MAEPVFVFKVALAGRKSIWRKIAIRGDQTLDDLHAAIFDAFDRFDEHLYSFYFPRPGAKKSVRSITHDGIEYACSIVCENPDPFSDHRTRNAAETKLDSLKLKPKQVFYYLFDFGDEWWHEIAVVQIDAIAEKGKYPRVLETRGASPPQYPDLEDDDEEDDDE